MNKAEIIAMAVECGIALPNGAAGVYIASVSEFQVFADRVAEKAIAEHLAKLQGDWLRSGDILYRQGESQSAINKDMIQVMVADGSYGLKKRADAASVLHKLLDTSLTAKQQESAPVLPDFPQQRHIRKALGL